MWYFKEGGWWLPAGETHVVEYMQRNRMRREGRLTYQYGKYEAAKAFVKQFRYAIDIGAHIGLWSFFMIRDFKEVIAFEPVEEHRKCYIANLPAERYHLYPYALGLENGKVLLDSPEGHSGNTRISSAGSLTADVRMLDGVKPPGALYEFPPIDFIKVDCEGFEYFALKGGEALLKKWRPCIVVEQRFDNDMCGRHGLPITAATDYLESLGAIVRKDLINDFVLSWDD